MLEGITDIPTLPQMTLELIRHAFEEEPDIKKLASLIEREPTLTAKLFKTVREKSGMAYYVHSSFEKLKGFLYVAAGIDTGNFETSLSRTSKNKR